MNKFCTYYSCGWCSKVVIFQVEASEQLNCPIQGCCPVITRMVIPVIPMIILEYYKYLQLLVINFSGVMGIIGTLEFLMLIYNVDNLRIALDLLSDLIRYI